MRNAGKQDRLLIKTETDVMAHFRGIFNLLKGRHFSQGDQGPHGSWKTLKVMELYNFVFSLAWKVMENNVYGTKLLTKHFF